MINYIRMLIVTSIVLTFAACTLSIAGVVPSWITIVAGNVMITVLVTIFGVFAVFALEKRRNDMQHIRIRQAFVGVLIVSIIAFVWSASALFALYFDLFRRT